MWLFLGTNHFNRLDISGVESSLRRAVVVDIFVFWALVSNGSAFLGVAHVKQSLSVEISSSGRVTKGERLVVSPMCETSSPICEPSSFLTTSHSQSTFFKSVRYPS